MSIGSKRDVVIENIKTALIEENYYKKVEVDDPELTIEQRREITSKFLSKRKTLPYQLKTFMARSLANIGSILINKDTKIIGEVDSDLLKNGAIITSNHFSPLENTIIRNFVLKNGKKRLNIVSQITNFALSGVVGFLMNYADTIPLNEDKRYLTRDFLEVLEELLSKKEVVLIYPEQEMWFNYRKPRPIKRGAYLFAAKLQTPIISCFVEIIDTDKSSNEGFYKVKYKLHILGTLYPEKNKSVRENSEELCNKDYELKKAAYERVYNRKLTYEFEKSDIAGWK